MTSKIPLCAALAAIGLAAAVPARAEPVRLAQAAVGTFVPSHEVISIVRSMRLDPITRPVRHGRDYILRAIDRRENEFRVVVDARIGRVVSVLPVIRTARAIEFDPPRRAWRGRQVPWADGYVPEWGEVPPPRAAMRRHARTAPDRGLGASIVHAPRSLPGDRPAWEPSRATASPPIKNPPLPRARPNEVASTGSIIAPADTTPAAAPQSGLAGAPDSEPAAERSEAPAKPEVPAVTPPF